MTLPSLERTVTHSTFVIERNYSKPVERVFAAFSDPARKRRWYAEGEGRGVLEFSMDFRVGGSDHAVFAVDHGPVQGSLITNDTVYQDIVPNQRIVMAYRMSLGDRCFSASLATVEFLSTGQGTSLVFTEQGAYFEGGDGPQLREKGWSGLLDGLDKILAE